MSVPIRERTSITLSVLEPSQTPTPLCYQGVIFCHTPPSPRLDNIILGQSNHTKQPFRKELMSIETGSDLELFAIRSLIFSLRG